MVSEAIWHWWGVTSLVQRRHNMEEEKKEDIKLDDAERTRCEIWTRCMGYFRPVDNFNIGKKQEFADRKYFSQSLAMDRIKEGHLKDAVDHKS